MRTEAQQTSLAAGGNMDVTVQGCVRLAIVLSALPGAAFAQSPAGDAAIDEVVLEEIVVTA
jgi:hypothetical protein